MLEYQKNTTMIGIHSFWTAPRIAANRPIAFSRLEVLVWIYSVLTFRSRNGPMWLYTDPAGRDFVSKIGVGAFYEKIIMLPSDLSETINPTMFWAAAKLIALSKTPCPCINLDFDAVLFQRLKIWNYCTAAHLEPMEWDYYRDDEMLYKSHGLKNFGCWNASPVNCSVVAWRSNECRAFYSTTSIAYMETLSNWQKDYPDCTPSRGTKSNPMVFAEQKLLGMTMERIGHSITPIGTIRGNIPILRRPSNMYHLWSQKMVYASAPADLVRNRAIEFLERSIRKEFPKAVWVLENLPTDAGQCIWPAEGPDNHFTRTITEVFGNVAIQDAIFPICRQAVEGSKMYYGEFINCSRGASCRVMDSTGQTPPVALNSNPGNDYSSDKTWETTPTTASAQ